MEDDQKQSISKSGPEEENRQHFLDYESVPPKTSSILIHEKVHFFYKLHSYLVNENVNVEKGFHFNEAQMEKFISKFWGTDVKKKPKWMNFSTFDAFRATLRTYNFEHDDRTGHLSWRHNLFTRDDPNFQMIVRGKKETSDEMPLPKAVSPPADDVINAVHLLEKTIQTIQLGVTSIRQELFQQEKELSSAKEQLTQLKKLITGQKVIPHLDRSKKPTKNRAFQVSADAGLVTLGKTCYMNSTLQCLNAVPELKSELNKYHGRKMPNNSSHLLTVATRDLFAELYRAKEPVHPRKFWKEFRNKYPEYDKKQNGSFMEQDAVEFWMKIMETLSDSLGNPNNSEHPEALKRLFGIVLLSSLHHESGEKNSDREFSYMLDCDISPKVKHLLGGLKHGLKNLKDSVIDELPRYLTVQFCRFYRDGKSEKDKKTLRKVEYPLELDVYDLCSPELRKKLEARRKLFDEAKKNGSKILDKNLKVTEVRVLDSEVAEWGITKKRTQQGSTSDGLITGIYDLVSVLTHKGDSGSTGHYYAAVKQRNGKWILFDDHISTAMHQEDVTKFCGGVRMNETAYVCMYKSRVTPNQGD